jgi:hypothetical protein
MKFIINIFRYLTSTSARGELTAKFFLKTKPSFNEYYIQFLIYLNANDKYTLAYLNVLKSHSYYPKAVKLLNKSIINEQLNHV